MYKQKYLKYKKKYLNLKKQTGGSLEQREQEFMKLISVQIKTLATSTGKREIIYSTTRDIIDSHIHKYGNGYIYTMLKGFLNLSRSIKNSKILEFIKSMLFYITSNPKYIEKLKTDVANCIPK